MESVGELWSRYQALILSRVSEGTGRAYLAAWRTRVGPTFESWDIATILPLDLEAAFAGWSGARSTRLDSFYLMSAIFRVAVKGGLIASNPCHSAELPKGKQAEPSARALSIDEVHRLLAILPPDGPYRRFVLAMLYTGCRLGEVAGLRLGDVDIEGRTIRVARTASPGLGGRMKIGPTKGRRTRLVPIADPLIPVILEASLGKSEHDYLFPGPRGGTLTSKNLSRALDWFEKRDQIKLFPPEEEPLHWHDMRHTAAIMVFHARMSAPDVQAIMGHSSLAVTQLYADTRAEAARRGAVALTAFYGDQSRGHQSGGENAAMIGADLSS